MQKTNLTQNKKHHSLSVVLATYNEEENIERCLQAVQGIVDEIIIADGSSTDNTVKIAKNYGAKIISTTNKPNFHINKQMAMDAATNTVVLQIDADEVVDDELKQWISQLLTTLNQTPERVIEKAWYLKRKNFFLGSWLSKGGQYPDPVIRIYMNGYAKLPQKDVHEQMIVDGLTGTAVGHLLHYSNPNFQTFVRKWNDYTSLKATQLNEAGVKTSFGNALKYLIWLPKKTFFLLYFRHKGLVDGIPGFVFAAMSGLYHAASYIKLWELQEKAKLNPSSFNKTTATNNPNNSNNTNNSKH
jgi:glycosyltransferase involved in cell wall biosynthesis